MFVALLLQVAVSHAGAQTTPTSTPPPVPRLEIYGFVMTDFGYDLMQNDPNWFDVTRPSKLPSFKNEFGRNGRTYAGVRQTVSFQADHWRRVFRADAAPEVRRSRQSLESTQPRSQAHLHLQL